MDAHGFCFLSVYLEFYVSSQALVLHLIITFIENFKDNSWFFLKVWESIKYTTIITHAMEKRVPFNELPSEIRNRLIKNKGSWLLRHDSPEGSEWVFRIAPLNDLFHIAITTPEDNDEADTIKMYKKEYLEHRCYTPLIVAENMDYLIDGYHHLTAFREAVEGDDNLPKKIECWVRVK